MTSESPVLDIPRTDDFEINGRGDHQAWKLVAPTPIASRGELPNPDAYRTWFKALWSPTGTYYLIDCADQVLTSTGLRDFEFLWTQDVVELFLWPSEKTPIYFEYQVSPLGSELAILVPNLGGHFLGWRPWQYDGDRKARRAVHVRGGDAKPGASITGWSAEFFIPTDLLRPLENATPAPGVTWRANVYRIDHDANRPEPLCRFSWKDVGANFHDFRNFATFRFV